MFDWMFRGGIVVDGMGVFGCRVDVGVRDGWIVVVGEVDEFMVEVVDCIDLIVVFGFVDVYIYYDV